MAKACIIYLVRHGESEHNRADIISGHGDPSLTDEGRQQVRATKQAFELAGVRFDDAYSSVLGRAVETAEIIYGQPVPKANRLAGLKERYWGSLEGKSRKHIFADAEKREAMTHQERWLYKHVPDMESDHEVSWRFISELEEIAKKNIGKTVLVVGHGGAIRAALMKIQNLTHREFPPGSFRNAGYAELVYQDGRFKVGQVAGVQI